uniref:Retrovirusrelated Pol polyprotein from transposon 297 n=1 Tax=Albugo laibachii Nc14 TaxID=890382 RepID=F0WXL3_9STRA|nr:Retrovirusrelated Pol polyprotein from transposon 297 [Albugo laibachii Nc14]|eukprot:CCA26207.1 Retrovirusrelated Pol polyprotein from transposon 297 [Albugo laibachii Nc14]
MEDGLWEILLGKPLLKKVGIDVEQQLDNLAEDHKVLEVDFGIDKSLEEDGDMGLDEHLSILVADTALNVADNVVLSKLQPILNRYRSYFKSDMVTMDAARVAPFELEMKKHSQHIRSAQRRHSPLISTVMAEQVGDLLNAGYIYKNPNLRCIFACMPVRKPGVSKWRLTIDYREVNKLIIPKCGMMPTRLLDMKGKTRFKVLDLHIGFWQLPLHKSSSEILAFATDTGIYTPLRVPQRSMDSDLHFQGCMADCFRSLINVNFLIWIDDILLFADNDLECFEVLSKVSNIADDKKLRINVRKSKLFLSGVTWFGKVYNG